MSWTTCRLGHRHWGRLGAAGVLVAEHGRALLQLRAAWAHSGGTWAVPGGARERGEDAVAAALREAEEELGLDAGLVTVHGGWAADCGGGWVYETVFAVPTAALTLRDLAESDGHRWVPAAEVSALPLHPSFRTAWEDAATGLRTFVEST